MSTRRPLGDIWKECQQFHLLDSVKSSTYEVIERAMRSGKPGVKIGGTNGKGMEYMQIKALKEWLKGEHNLESEIVKKDVVGDVFSNLASNVVRDYAQAALFGNTNNSNSQNSQNRNSQNNFSQNQNSQNQNSQNRNYADEIFSNPIGLVKDIMTNDTEYFLEVYWDKQGWNDMKASKKSW